MSRTIPTILALTLALGLGSSWADESPETPELTPVADETAVLAEELATRLAQSLSDDDVDPGILAEKPAEDHGDQGILASEPWLRAQLPVPPMPMPERSQVRTCLAGGSAGCELAKDIAAMPACLDPEDCPAYEAWKEAYRQPESRVVPAEPYSWSKPELVVLHENDKHEDDKRKHP